MRIRSYSFLIIILCGLLSHTCWADLLVSPTHLAFSERDRSKELILVNNGNEIRTYRLEWQQKKALPTGGYATLIGAQANEINKASPMIRFSPKQVTLAPNERQVIRLGLRKPKNLADGEYRSHLLLKALPVKKKKDESQTGLGVNLKLRMSYSLPVLIKQGKIDVKVDAVSADFIYDSKRQKGDVTVNFLRSGIHSSNGDITAYWTPKNGNQTRLMIARLNAYSIYPEIENSTIHLAWVGANFVPSPGTLSILYAGKGIFSGEIFVDKSFELTPSIK
tara:strand:+ start:1114 stop:1947 length:834 start_codon:yes stop_codon:yes gene_type:complete